MENAHKAGDISLKPHRISFNARISMFGQTGKAMDSEAKIIMQLLLQKVPTEF